MQPSSTLMPFLRIVLFGVFVAIAYGIVHDQVTVRICVEYFTIGHPQIFPTTSPTLLAFGWGIVATWWVGLPLGILLAIAARAGERPKRSVADLYRPTVALVSSMTLCALAAGMVGGLLALSGKVYLVPPLADAVPAARHTRFLVDLWAHNGSYAAGILGGVVLILFVWRSRKVPARAAV